MEVRLQHELETKTLFRLQIIYSHDTGRSQGHDVCMTYKKIQTKT